MFAVCDCDNCYCSCERVFRPDLNGRPVVVLSNNDGCVVARSNEAKQLGVKMGMPYFRMRQLFPNADITALSSNYELYGDMTGRVMTLLRRACPGYFFRYSIDEAFCELPDDWPPERLRAWGQALHTDIKRGTGMPVSIGMGRTKTLAKLASHFAKRYPGYHHACLIDTDEQREKALALCPIGDVWGIGRRNTAKLQALGVATALDFARWTEQRVNQHFTVTALRTWRELNGTSCIENEKMAAKQSICVSRSFDGMVDDAEILSHHVANFSVHVAQKLRRQGTVAGVVGVFIDTNRFRDDLEQYYNYADRQLLTPSSSSTVIAATAQRILDSIFKAGRHYKRAGVVALGLLPDNAIQTNLLNGDGEHVQRQRRLDALIDRLNNIEGENAVQLASQQYRPGPDGKPVHFADALRHAFRSPNYTTRWTDLILLK